jgi:hypothetical protein
MIGITTFGDNRLKRSLKRFQTQSHSIDIFDEISINSDDDLPLWYRQEHAERLIRGSRGFGYWCWKPFIILQTLKNMPALDMLFWCDAGCHVRPQGRDRMSEYIEAFKVSSCDLLAFQGSIDGVYFDYDGRKLPDVTEAHWTKGDLFHAFKIDKDHPHAHSTQFGAGIFGVKNNSTVKDMLQTWVDLTRDSPFLFNDENSMEPNLSGFIANRHDQSYFSLCAKTMGAVRFSAFEYWYPESNEKGSDILSVAPDWKTIDRSPFHAMRDRPIAPWWRAVNAARRLFMT